MSELVLLKFSEAICIFILYSRFLFQCYIPQKHTPVTGWLPEQRCSVDIWKPGFWVNRLSYLAIRKHLAEYILYSNQMVIWKYHYVSECFCEPILGMLTERSLRWKFRSEVIKRSSYVTFIQRIVYKRSKEENRKTKWSKETFQMYISSLLEVFTYTQLSTICSITCMNKTN